MTRAELARIRDRALLKPAVKWNVGTSMAKLREAQADVLALIAALEEVQRLALKCTGCGNADVIEWSAVEEGDA